MRAVAKSGSTRAGSAAADVRPRRDRRRGDGPTPGRWRRSKRGSKVVGMRVTKLTPAAPRSRRCTALRVGDVITQAGDMPLADGIGGGDAELGAGDGARGLQGEPPARRPTRRPAADAAAPPGTPEPPAAAADPTATAVDPLAADPPRPPRRLRRPARPAGPRRRAAARPRRRAGRSPPPAALPPTRPDPQAQRIAAGRRGQTIPPVQDAPGARLAMGMRSQRRAPDPGASNRTSIRCGSTPRVACHSRGTGSEATPLGETSAGSASTSPLLSLLGMTGCESGKAKPEVDGSSGSLTARVASTFAALRGVQARRRVGDVPLGVRSLGPPIAHAGAERSTAPDRAGEAPHFR